MASLSARHGRRRLPTAEIWPTSWRRRRGTVPPSEEVADLVTSTPEGYRALDDRSLADYLATLPAIRSRLGGEPAAWRVREVGDGNLNLVFIVEGPAGVTVGKKS